MSEEILESEIVDDQQMATKPADSRRPKKMKSRVVMLIRRIHLYAGLFLLPWVFLYGITGAMFNHQGLLPEIDFQPVPAAKISDSSLRDFPSPADLAQQVVASLEEAAPESTIHLRADHGAEFTNNVSFELWHEGVRYGVHVDPIDKSASVGRFPKVLEPTVAVLPEIKNLKLAPDPFQLAKQAVPEILAEVGVEHSGSISPLGYSKLNFLASVDDQPVRVTYVLRDGHIDVSKYDGNDGMSARQFFMRLHTTHIQPPHWNGRFLWTLIVDAMAIAMVSWGITGLVMWWQIKRTRRIGGIVLLLSLATASSLYFAVQQYYATTKL